MQIRTQQMQLGGLKCQVLDALGSGNSPKLAVILCHGYGAPGGDLVAIGAELFAVRPQLADQLLLIFPAAPISLDQLGLYGGLAWWHIDVAAISDAIRLGELRQMPAEMPDGLLESREALLRLVEDVRERWKLGYHQLVLGGFSQGAILTTDIALRLPEAPAALAIFSGTLVAEEDWRAEAQRHGSRLRVLQSHGRFDPILPFEGAQWLCELLEGAGARVDFVAFEGPHTIPMIVLTRFAAMVASLTE